MPQYRTTFKLPAALLCWLPCCFKCISVRYRWGRAEPSLNYGSPGGASTLELVELIKKRKFVLIIKIDLSPGPSIGVADAELFKTTKLIIQLFPFFFLFCRSFDCVAVICVCKHMCGCVTVCGNIGHTTPEVLK